MSSDSRVPAASDDEIESGLASRAPESPAGRAAFWIGIVVSIAHIYFNTLGTLSELWVSVLHFASFGLLCALLYPSWRAHSRVGAGAALALDVVLGLLAVSCAVYLIAGEEAFYARGASFRAVDWVFTSLAVILAIEFARRTTGWIIPILIIIALTYVTWWGRYVPGVLTFPGLSWETVLFRSFYGDEGLFGSIATISATYVFMFILFGAFLIRSGAGAFIIDLARCVAGRFIGGPGLVAVFASGLTGTISGSAVANTVSTGVITIPLMKRAGYRGRFAGGVEAAASTGGQLMPPIMGAGAFVMASYTQIPYLDIVAVSFLPAVLYFMTVAFFVRIEARRQNLTTMGEDAPAIGQVLRQGGPAFLLPITVLIGLLIYGFTPTYAAGISMVAVVVASWLTPNRMGPMAILEALALGARNMVMTAVLLIAVGLIVNVIATTGIGNTFSLMIAEWAGNNLLIAIVLIALASLVLGMGLPVTAAYIVLATLSAPALNGMIVEGELVRAIANGNIAEEAKAIFMLVAPDKVAALGLPMSSGDARALLAQVPPDFLSTLHGQMLTPAVLTAALLSAHMIIFWLSQDSNVTPPVCLTAFAAAAIAKSPPMATGFQAWKLAKGLYIVPLLFAYTPLIGGAWYEVLEIFAFGLVGLYAISGVLQGHLEAPLGWPLRLVMLAAGSALLWPHTTLLHVAGLVVFAAVFALNLRAARSG